MNVLDKAVVLKLNKYWLPLTSYTPRDCFGDLYSGSVHALDIQYSADGKVEDAIPLKWNEWVKLDVRNCDFGVRTPEKLVRVPTVVVVGYEGTGKRKQKTNFENIWKRDKGICQYSNRKLRKEEADLDHYIPRKLGGKTVDTNLVVCDKRLNRIKGCKTAEEVGFKLVKPIKPLPPEEVYTPRIDEIRHPDWMHFLVLNK